MVETEKGNFILKVDLLEGDMNFDDDGLQWGMNFELSCKTKYKDGPIIGIMQFVASRQRIGNPPSYRIGEKSMFLDHDIVNGANASNKQYAKSYLYGMGDITLDNLNYNNSLARMGGNECTIFDTPKENALYFSDENIRIDKRLNEYQMDFYDFYAKIYDDKIIINPLGIKWGCYLSVDIANRRYATNLLSPKDCKIKDTHYKEVFENAFIKPESYEIES